MNKLSKVRRSSCKIYQEARKMQFARVAKRKKTKTLTQCPSQLSALAQLMALPISLRTMIIQKGGKGKGETQVEESQQAKRGVRLSLSF